jgi:hypothetical protein
MHDENPPCNPCNTCCPVYNLTSRVQHRPNTMQCVEHVPFCLQPGYPVLKIHQNLVQCVQHGLSCGTPQKASCNSAVASSLCNAMQAVLCNSDNVQLRRQIHTSKPYTRTAVVAAAVESPCSCCSLLIHTKVKCAMYTQMHLS